MPNAATFTGDTVPLGQAGTGAAYILPQSTAINQASDYIDQQNQAKAQAAANAQQQAQQLAKDWQANRVNIKAGTLWQPEINDKANAVMQQGLQLRQQGLDPAQYYNDPDKQAKIDDYNQKRQEVMNMAEARDAYAKEAQETDKQISADNGELDPPTIDAYHAFFKTPLADHMKNGDMLPSVKKAINLEEQMHKFITPKPKTEKVVQNGFEITNTVPDTDGNRTQFRNMVNTDPVSKKYITQKIGMDPTQLNSVTDKTDLPGIIQDVDATLRSPDGIKLLAHNGINSYGSYSTPSGQQVADDGTINQADAGDQLGQFTENPQYTAAKMAMANQIYNSKQAYQKIEDNAVNSLNAKVATDYSKIPNYTQWQHANQVQEANQRNTKFQQEQTDRKNKTDSDVVYNQPAVATEPEQIGKPGVAGHTTLPAMLPSSGKTFQANPAEVWNPQTGHYGTNVSGPFQFEAGSPAYTPMIQVTDANGNTYKQFVNDDQVKAIKAGTFKIGNVPITTANLHYPLMVGGTKVQQVPEMVAATSAAPGAIATGKDPSGNITYTAPSGKFTTTKTPVVIDANSVRNSLYDKKINDDAIEVKMPPDVQQRIIADKIKQRYPEITDDKLANAVNIYYNNRQQQYKNQ